MCLGLRKLDSDNETMRDDTLSTTQGWAADVVENWLNAPARNQKQRLPSTTSAFCKSIMRNMYIIYIIHVFLSFNGSYQDLSITMCVYERFYSILNHKCSGNCIKPLSNQEYPGFDVLRNTESMDSVSHTNSLCTTKHL